MRTRRLLASLLAAAPLLALCSVSRASPPALPHRIAIDARGPLALVEVTRAVAFDRSGCDATLEMALPEGGVMVAVEVRDRGRWRRIDAPDARASERFEQERTARRRDCDPESQVDAADSETTERLRLVARDGLRGPATVRYRFAATVSFTGGRYHLRFPAAPESVPIPADVSLTTRDASDVEIAGARVQGGGATALGHATTRSGWEVSWAPRGPEAGDAPTVAARVAAAPISAREIAVAYALRGRASRPQPGPSSVLFVIDRSRSVGLPGLSAERDVARRLLEILPPATRFDALFFDRGPSKLLFPLPRPATREAIEALEAEMVPDRLQNGTDLVTALREAGALLRREPPGPGRVLLAIVTDGALPERQDAAALDRALGPLPGLDVAVAAFVVRPPDDDPMPPSAAQSLHGLAGLRGGVARDLRTPDISDGVAAALADLDRGGDVGLLRLAVDGRHRLLADALAPGAALSGVVIVPSQGPRAAAPTIDGLVRGQRVAVPAPPAPIAADWLRPWAASAGTPGSRLLLGTDLVALVEPIAHPSAQGEPLVRGSMDRLVIRNVLSLAYMPRARACYLGRTGATAALRDLTGRVRLAIDVVRGEVERASIESSTLNQSTVEDCLRDEAYAIEVPRAVRSDAPVTAVLNLNFRPHTQDKPAPNLGAVGDQIDLIIESAFPHDEAPAQADAPTTPAATPPTAFPTR
jgi:Mg-chelatase subunit ChlD